LGKQKSTVSESENKEQESYEELVQRIYVEKKMKLHLKSRRERQKVFRKAKIRPNLTSEVSGSIDAESPNGKDAT